MKTETEIIHALEELKKAYQIKLKNIDRAITCISTASMIVDAVKDCHVKQMKAKLQVPPAPPVPPVDRITSNGKGLIPPQIDVIKDEGKTLRCLECGKEFIKTTSRMYCSKKCYTKVKNRNYTAKVKLKQESSFSRGQEIDHTIPAVAVASSDISVHVKHVDPGELKKKLDKIRQDIPIHRERPEIQRSL